MSLSVSKKLSAMENPKKKLVENKTMEIILKKIDGMTTHGLANIFR